MKLRNNIFAAALDYLKRNTEIKTQKEEIKTRDKEIKTLTESNKAYEKNIEELKEIGDTNSPKAQKIIQSLMLL